MNKNIHKFKQGGNFIILDVNSGGVHLVDELIYNMVDEIKLPLLGSCPEYLIEKFSGYSRKDVEDCYGELYELREKGELFTEDDYEKYAETSVMAPIKAMCLHVAHDCNLRCRYCFASTGDFGGDRGIMSAEYAKKALDFLVEHSGDRENLEVDFFGGEPLMAWDTVKEAVKYGRSIEKASGKNFRFTITTNGVLLDDEKIEFINKEMSNVVMSLDGRKSVNDNMRPTVNEKGSYDVIVPKYKKLLETRKEKGRTDHYLRGTFTNRNLDFTNDIIAMNDEGFREISLEPAVLYEKLDFALKASDIPAVLSEYDKLYEIMREGKHNFNFFHFNIDLAQGPCVIKRLRGCGAGNEYVAVTPEGDIYPCHQFVGNDKFLMGNIFTLSEKPLNMEIKEYFSKTHVYSKKGCPECWARFYCSGGCNAESYIYEGDARTPHAISCEFMKKRIECAIGLIADRNTETLTE